MNLVLTMAKWLDCFLLSIRDYMLKNRFSLKPKRKLFVQIINKIILLFKISYLKEDLQDGIISRNDAIYIEDSIINQTSYNANMIFSEISIEIQLPETDAIKKIILFAVSFFKLAIVLKKIKSWINSLRNV